MDRRQAGRNRDGPGVGKRWRDSERERGLEMKTQMGMKVGEGCGKRGGDGGELSLAAETNADKH